LAQSALVGILKGEARQVFKLTLPTTAEGQWTDDLLPICWIRIKRLGVLPVRG